MKNPPDPEAFARRVIDLGGGREEVLRLLDESLARISTVWDQDATLIGRILRAHLFVEHFLGEYLRSRNPNLGDLSEGRLSFAQKLSLLDRKDPRVSYLIPGIRRLNAIRNRMAHTYRATVSNDDAAVFLSVPFFRHLRVASAASATPNDDPLDILEAFARHAGSALAGPGDRLSTLFETALASPLHLT